MSSKPLISGIMIFLNAEKFIEEAILSVFAQTYDNWELLLVDDGSTDNSTAIAQKYAEKYPEKVRYLEHPNHQNLGKSVSRNFGISNAIGEYIAFLDADDIWLAPKLEKQLAILQSHPQAGMVYGPTQMWFSWTGKPEDMARDRYRKLGVKPDTLIQPPNLVPLFLRTIAETPGTCGVLIKREVVEAVGGHEESFRSMYEDQAFFAKICLKYPVFIESGCWDKYRQHPDSTCYVAERTGEYHITDISPSYATYLNWLEGYLVKEKLVNTEVWQALQRVLFFVRHPSIYDYYRRIRSVIWKFKALLKK
ncbi:family 2 glycosyl transferase [Tolypothrix sp. NIES-4075]|uniref:glycosyltransferase family 2 protein n=1 Tax=Tolypothrix sp. NIES-4075 TaxID=2005459 RepID=UPI000B5CEB04|nr:glycosyltransferase family A protein [Tolypothrix sp. NIES-4075]GAX41894.1 family 2 glycosyl transferase [Tolypothrix sp. NIES-4075]